MFVNWSSKSRATLTDNLFNKMYNKTKPTSRSVRESKKMIKDMGNGELFELIETDPKTQRRECLMYWSQGIVNCTCGISGKKVKPTKAPSNVHWTSQFKNYAMKKGRPHGHRYGKPQEETQNLRKRCIKRGFAGIHSRFLKDPEFRESQLGHDRTEEVCIQMDELAQKDFSHHMTQAEYFRYRNNWWMTLNNSGRSGPLRDRSDCNDALSTLNRLHQESGEPPTQVPATAPIIEFFLQLVAIAIPAGAHVNSKKVHK